jgi:trimeric autotransporter adhesin
MKKLLFGVALFGALTLTVACGGKTENGGTGDSTLEPIDTAATVAMVEQGQQASAEVQTALSEAVASGDAQKVQTTIDEAKKHIDELVKNGNNAEAYAYAKSLEEYVNQNKEALNALKVDGQTSVADAVQKIVSLPENVKTAGETAYSAAKTQLSNTVSTAANAAENAATEAVEGVKTAADNAAKEAVNTATEKVNNAKAAVDNKVNEAKTNAQKKATDAVNNATKKANDAVNSAAQTVTNGIVNGLTKKK